MTAEHSRVGEIIRARDLIRMLVFVIVAETIVVCAMVAYGDWWIFIEIVPVVSLSAFSVGFAVGRMWEREHHH